jgi:hypothetical protein
LISFTIFLNLSSNMLSSSSSSSSELPMLLYMAASSFDCKPSVRPPETKSEHTPRRCEERPHRRWGIHKKSLVAPEAANVGGYRSLKGHLRRSCAASPAEVTSYRAQSCNKYAHLMQHSPLGLANLSFCKHISTVIPVGFRVLCGFVELKFLWYCTTATLGTLLFAIRLTSDKVKAAFHEPREDRFDSQAPGGKKWIASSFFLQPLHTSSPLESPASPSHNQIAWR